LAETTRPIVEQKEELMTEIRNVTDEAWRSGYRHGFSQGISAIVYGLLIGWAFILLLDIFLFNWSGASIMISLTALGIAGTNLIVFEMICKGILKTPTLGLRR